MRGLAPTDTTIVSASIRSKSVPVSPLAVDTITAPAPSSRPSPVIEPDARADELGLHVFGLLPRESEEPFVDGGEVDGDLGTDGLAGLPAGEELHTEVGGLADGVGRLGRRDERLRRNDVGDDRRAADADPFDQGDVRAELGSRERRFIPAGTTSEYGDSLLALELVGHGIHSLASGYAPPNRADERDRPGRPNRVSQ